MDHRVEEGDSAHVDDRTSLERILSPLAYQPRIDILLALRRHKYKLTTLSKNLVLSMPEVHRNLSLLFEANLIKKDADNNIFLSPLGVAVTTQIHTFRFLADNSSYFDTHGLGEIPDRFLQGLGALEKSTLNVGWVNVVERWKDIIGNAKEYFYVITTQAGSDNTEFVFQKLRENGFKLKTILPEKPIIIDKMQDILKKHKVHELYANGSIERRIAKSVHLVVMINEKQAAVMFPNERNEVDFKALFFSEDCTFHEWCLDYFSYCWNRASPPT